MGVHTRLNGGLETANGYPLWTKKAEATAGDGNSNSGDGGAENSDEEWQGADKNPKVCFLYYAKDFHVSRVSRRWTTNDGILLITTFPPPPLTWKVLVHHRRQGGGHSEQMRVSDTVGA